jgi:hypothetical protein
VALSAYGARAGADVRVYAPRDTPARLLEQVQVHGADLHVLDGHIGDCGRVSREWADASGAFDVSTLREPYRIEGKKTLGLEIAEQMDWHLPDAILYPTGGGTGLIGMWGVTRCARQGGCGNARHALQRPGLTRAVIRAFDLRGGSLGHPVTVRADWFRDRWAGGSSSAPGRRRAGSRRPDES